MIVPSNQYESEWTQIKQHFGKNNFSFIKKQYLNDLKKKKKCPNN